MTFQRIRYIAWRGLTVAAGLLVLGVLVFFGLTRTQAGRNVLRNQMERRFNERFRGRLAIDSLSGNLVRELTARDVRLYDAEGRLLASIDSLTARPHWSDLLDRRLSIRRLTLHSPSVYLRRDAGGGWNLASAFQRAPSAAPRAAEPDSTRQPISLAALDLRIVNGTVTTRNAGAAPQLVAQHKVFNYAQARLVDLDAQLSVRRAGRGLRFQLTSFSARLADPAFRIEHLAAKGVLGNDSLQLDRFRLDTGRSRITGEVFAERATSASGAPPDSLALRVRARPLDFDEGRRLLPALPLHGQVQLRADARGALSDLRLRGFSMERGASRLSATGRVQGLPQEARFRLSFEENTLTPDDLAAVAPSLVVDRLRNVGATRFSLDLNGEATPPAARASGWRLNASAEGSARTQAGPVEGRVQLTRKKGQAPAYEAEVRSSGLDLGQLTGVSALRGATKGRVAAQGRLGNAPDSLNKITVALQDTRLRVLGLAALDLDVTAQGGELGGTARLRQAQGGLYARFHIDSTGAVPSYRLTARARQANLAPLLRGVDSMMTRLNGHLTFRGSGTDWTTAQGRGQLQMDSSLVRYGDQAQHVPAFKQKVRLTSSPADTSRLRVEGEVLTASLSAPLSSSLSDLGAYWLQGARQAARRVYQKSYRGDAQPALLSRSPAAPPDAQPVGARGRLHLKRPGVLAALLPPSAPRLPAHLRARFRMTMQPDSLYLRLRSHADTLRRGALALVEPRVRLRAAAGSPGELEHSLQADAWLAADTLHVGDQAVPAAQLTLRHRRGSSRIRLTSGSPDQPGPLRLVARLDQQPQRNRLTVQALRVAAPGYAWTLAGAAPIDLYADAVVVPDLTLQNADSATRQQIGLEGVLSEAPTDTLFMAAQRVSLADLSDLASLHPTLGGQMNGRLAFTGGRSTPELTGRMNVRSLSFDDRLLGHFTLESHYAERADEGITVKANLRPLPGLSRPFPSDSVTAGGLHVEPDRLQLAGTVELPGSHSPGSLDLNLNAQRVDLFFLEYIFDHKVTDVQGALAGTGRVRGSFRTPRIRADLQLAGGQFSIPRFQTHYRASGPVRMDVSGIDLSGLQLNDPTGGTASLDGRLKLNDYKYLSFDLAASLDAFRVVNVTESDSLPFYGRIWGSGQFTLKGPLSGAALHSSEVVIAPKSDVYIPVEEDQAGADTGYIVFADSSGRVPDIQERRENIFSDRPAGERKFTEGLDLDLNLVAQSGTTVHLVIDPLLGDQIDAEGSGRLQLQRSGGTLSTYGSLEVSGGQYLFTAGALFTRRFRIQEGGTLRWTGPPGNPQLDLVAAYRTRASTNGLPDNLTAGLPSYLPISVLVDVDGRVQTPRVQLDLALNREAHNRSAGYEGLQAYLRQSSQSTEYATSVLLTNSFLLTPSLASQSGGAFASTRRQIAFNSVSQLVASQLNRYLSKALPNFNLSFGLQGQNAEELGITYGMALHLLDERLIIRGEGAYQNKRTTQKAQGLQGEFVVEVRLSPRVSAEVFYRREGDLLGADLTNTTGVGLSYETVFSTWGTFLNRFLRWLGLHEGDEQDDGNNEQASASLPFRRRPIRAAHRLPLFTSIPVVGDSCRHAGLEHEGEVQPGETQ